jgi:hypothetical protein
MASIVDGFTRKWSSMRKLVSCGCGGFGFGSLVQIHGEMACFNKNSVYLVVGYVFVVFVI